MGVYNGLKQHHLTISVYPDQWDKIQFDSASTGKSVSRYICDKVLDYIKKNGAKEPYFEYKKVIGTHVVKSLSFFEEEYQFIRNTAKQVVRHDSDTVGMKQSEFIRNIVLYY